MLFLKIQLNKRGDQVVHLPPCHSSISGAERKTFATLSTQNRGTEAKGTQLGNLCRHNQVSCPE